MKKHPQVSDSPPLPKVRLFSLSVQSRAHGASHCDAFYDEDDDDSLRLRHMQTLAAHETAVDDEQERDGVDLEGGSGEPEAAGDVGEDAVLRDPPGHEGVEAQGRGDGRALEVARLAGGVLGDVGGRDVEASEAREAAEHEEHETCVVESRAQADAEGYAGRGQTERYLSAHQKVSG